MSAGDRDTLALAEVLAEHRPNRYNEARCICKEKAPIGLGITGTKEWHHAHVADVIASSDWLREQRTEAWKAGHGWCDDGIDGFCFHEPFTPNPYLED